MKLTEVTNNKTQTQRILNESWQELTEVQQVYLTKFEKELWPLMENLVQVFEAELTPDQIQAIFQNAEETAMASGNNSTVAGKIGKGAAAAAKLPVDAMKAVNKKVDELGRLAQKAGPVQNADAKFEKLKKDIMANKPDNKIVQGIQAVSDWAKANPGKASLAIGILTAVAAFAAGPAGGAAAGFLLRSTKGLLQGEKLSSAVGGAAKAAAYGALAGAAMEYITDNILDNIFTATEAELEAMEASFKQLNDQQQLADIAAKYGADVGALDGVSKIQWSGNINAFNFSYDVAMNPAQLATLDQLQAAVDGAETFSKEYYEAATKMHNFMGEVQNNPANIKLTGFFDAVQDAPDTFFSDAQWNQIIAKADDQTELLNMVSKSGDSMGAALQAGITAAEKRAPEAMKAKPVPAEEKKQLELDLKGGGMNEPKEESLSMEDKFELYLMERDPRQGELPLDNPNSLGAKAKRGLGNLAAKAKAGVSGAASKAGAAVKQAGKDIGNKVTANKLMKAWKAAGEPTDTGSIVNILSDAGIDDAQIQTIGQNTSTDLKVQPAGSSDAAASVDKDGDGVDDNTGKPVEPAAKGATDANADGKDDKTGQPVKRNPKIRVAKGAGQVATASDGQSYVWGGAQWVNNATAKMATKQIAAELGNPKLKSIADQIKQAKLQDAVIKMLSSETV
jgi:hypothetical protein